MNAFLMAISFCRSLHIMGCSILNWPNVYCGASRNPRRRFFIYSYQNLGEGQSPPPPVPKFRRLYLYVLQRAASQHKQKYTLARTNSPHHRGIRSKNPDRLIPRGKKVRTQFTYLLPFHVLMNKKYFITNLISSDH